MLQQTQVTAVIPYYRRFMSRFPDVAALARADIDDVLAYWSGLGYYSRARNLHRAAQNIVFDHAGLFPRDIDAVMALPGVGRSTAAAICVFAFGSRHAILDGNVKRVLARFFGIAGYPGEKTVSERLWRKAETLLPHRNIAAYTQGLMDLGAGVCVRRQPHCDECPVRGDCVARRRGLTAQLPSPRPKKTLPRRRTTMLILRYAHEVLLEKRPPTGVWGGLWSFPEAHDGVDLRALCRSRFGAIVRASTALPEVEHGFTHFKLDIQPQVLEVVGLEPHVAAAGYRWVAAKEAVHAALPAPVRRLLGALDG